MAKGIIKSIVKSVVESGTILVVGQVAKVVTDTFVPKKSGISGLFQDICVGAARFAVTYRASESMGDYVESKYDKTSEACKNVIKALDEMRNKEETEDGEPEIEVICNSEACAD